MRMVLSLSRSDTNTTPHYWLDVPILECHEWIDLINKVHSEQEKKQKTRK